MENKDETTHQVTDKGIMFNDIEQGFCIIEVLFDDDGSCVDYRFQETNSVFETQMGLSDVVGKKMLDLSPKHEQHWFKTYGEVVRSRRSAHFEMEASHLKNGIWYDVFAFPHGPEDSNQVAVLFSDITARKRQELDLTFLSEISKALVELDSIEKTMAIMGEKIGNHFGVDWCMFAEIVQDPEPVAVSYGWNAPGTASLNGTYHMKDFFSEEQLDGINAGELIIIHDIHKDAETSVENYGELGIQSLVIHPLASDHQWKFMLSILHNEPRQWHEHEIALIRELANRIWARLERARSENALRLSEEKYRKLFDSMDEGYCIIQMIYNESGKAVDWLFLQVNRAFEPNNGLHNAEGKTICELAPDIEPKWMEIYDRVAQTGEPLRFREDSTALKRIFNLYAFRIGEPEERKVAVIFTDITQQARAEEALIRSEEKARAVMQLVPALLWQIDAQTGNISWNEQWLKYTGQTLEESQNEGWFDPVHPEDRPKTERIFDKAYQKGKPFEVEHRIRRNDGVYRWFLVRQVPVPGKNGEVTQWYGAAIDIHDRKAAEEGTRDSELRLQKLVAERTAALQRSNEDLRQFAHVASHDLKEPVRKIKTFYNRIRNEFGGELPEKVNGYIHKIGSATDRMISMVEGVLTYSKTDDPGQEIEMVDLYQIFKDIQSDLELMIQRKDARISVGELPVVVGFRVLLHQLFCNLMLNSLKFSKEDVPAEIGVCCEKITHEEKPYFEITFSDNGIGFESAYAEKIFTTFTRLHSTQEYEGTGLGLALCKKIVLRHQGNISAKGIPGKGATFTVLLPA